MSGPGPAIAAVLHPGAWFGHMHRTKYAHSDSLKLNVSNAMITQVPGSKDGENMVPYLEKESISSNDLNSESLTGLV